MTTVKPILEAVELYGGYGAIPVLSNISLSVQVGEAVGVLGHNGMGKTTLMRTLVGALPVTAGEVLFQGESITGLRPHQRARRGMAYVPQGREIFPTLSVYDNLKFGAIHSGGEAKSIIDELLVDFPRLGKLLDRLGGSLSGGEQQLLALARALAGRPSLLLLDEPTEGIQPSIIEEITETLSALRARKNLTIVLVEQNLEFLVAVVERVLVIRRGQLGGEIPREHLRDLDIVNQYAGVHA
ncbi:ATP-binding cassette domain-containing protein [Paraburkholderia dilworthii]|uniref:ATP-binding cassette domain-containing protein n=1 Tax=Paraburkholderia dilworthii TaxID=948106 RepID=UPI00055D1BDA|nr:ATP-binding cassette domain-containing protein [Paraburkholderia dilworthii]